MVRPVVWRPAAELSPAEQAVITRPLDPASVYDNRFVAAFDRDDDSKDGIVVAYTVRADVRGRYPVGPLVVRLTDGLAVSRAAYDEALGVPTEAAATSRKPLASPAAPLRNCGPSP